MEDGRIPEDLLYGELALGKDSLTGCGHADVDGRMWKAADWSDTEGDCWSLC